MDPSAADEESSPAPAVNEVKTPVESAGAGVGAVVQEGVGSKEMEAADAAAVAVPNEVEPHEAAGADPEEEEEEDPDEDEAEEDTDEEAEEDPEEEEEGEENAGQDEEAVDGKEASVKEIVGPEIVMAPLAVVKPGEVEDEKNEHGELDGEEGEPSEVDEDPEEVASEEDPAEEGGEAMAEDTTKGSAEDSAVHDINGIPQEQHAKHGLKNKDKVADLLSNENDAGGSINGDVQKSELAGGLEIFVDELPNDCGEEDVAMVFSQCAEVKSVRIIKNPSTEKNKDIAFVCYASIEAAEKALVQFKEGIEVKGKKVRVSACEENNTLYLGNICKSWTKDQVLSALKSVGIQECKISLPANYKGGNRGFAFLKFASHYYARAAFRRLMKPDAIFGADRSVKVSFYQCPTKLNEDLMETKTVYLEHVPLSWNEDKIKECCEEYGKILKVDLFQILKGMKSETFSFVEFSSSKNALACVEGVNNANIVDGDLKLSACLARPKSGFTVNSGAISEGATTSKKEKDHKEKVDVYKNSPHKLPKGNKSKLVSQTNMVIVKKNSPSKLPTGTEKMLTSQDSAEVRQTSKPSEGKRKLGKNKNASVNQRPSKKAWNNCNVDDSKLTYQGTAVVQTPSPSKGKRKSGKNKNTYINERPLKKAHNNSNVLTRRSNRTRGTGPPAGPQYASNSQAYYSTGGSSRSKAYASDLEPHAGFIPSATLVHSTHAYDQRRSAQYDVHPIDVHSYAKETAPSRSTYSGYTSHAGYQDGYAYIYAPPPTSRSYYPGSDPFITRRRDY